MKPDVTAPLIKIHTSLLFNSKSRTFDKNLSIIVAPTSGTIVNVQRRENDDNIGVGHGDIDLRGKVVMPGFVDAHTHVFLHSYE